MNVKNNKSGFTLIELMIVVLIIAILAALALPKFLSITEFAKSGEALSNADAIKNAIDRCGYRTGSFATSCGLGQLDIKDPNTNGDRLFQYTLANVGQTSVTILATRNTHNGGDNTSTVYLKYTSILIQKGGTGVFANL